MTALRSFKWSRVRRALYAAHCMAGLMLGIGRTAAQPSQVRLAAPETGGLPRRPASRAFSDDAALASSVTRDALVRVALAKSPALAAAAARGRALRAQGDAESKLPPPTAEVQIWQVPVREPYRVDRAGMTMIGLRQEFPPGGAREARAHAARVEATVEDAMRTQEAWMLAREVEHAFADYVAAIELVHMHEHHLTAAERVSAYARARYAGGGPLQDIAQAEREIAMIATDLAMARSQVELARARINGLLLRSADAPLGPPVAPGAEQAEAEVESLLKRAARTRPELDIARRKHESARAMAEAESRMANSPMIGVGAYYFPPTDSMPTHGFGLSVSSTLPWLWGDLSARSRAAEVRRDAALQEQDAARARIALDVMTSAAQVQVALSQLRTLQERALPASRRAEEATLAGYEAGRADIVGFLMARTALLETELSIVNARAALAHAVTDLRWAAGGAARSNEALQLGASHGR